MPSERRIFAPMVLIAVSFLFPLLSGCLGGTPPPPPPAGGEDQSTGGGGDAESDPLDTTFKANNAIQLASNADAFQDVNPFGYENPLR